MFFAENNPEPEALLQSYESTSAELRAREGRQSRCSACHAGEVRKANLASTRNNHACITRQTNSPRDLQYSTLLETTRELQWSAANVSTLIDYKDSKGFVAVR